MRPGCAIVQAALGASEGIANNFPVETWVVHPTAGMKLYDVTEEQLAILVERTTQAAARQPE